MPKFCSPESGLLLCRVELMWSSCGVVLSNKIERTQNYALRIIFQKRPRTSSAELREAAGWTTLKTRRHNAMLCKVHWCLRSRGPSYLTCKFHTNSNLNYTTTRGANKIHLLRPNTNFYRSTFEFIGAHDKLTIISHKRRNINSTQIFKHALKGLVS